MPKKPRSNKAKHVSPQTRVKLQRAAKARKRAPKNSPHAGEFIDAPSHNKLAGIFHQTVATHSFQPHKASFGGGPSEPQEPSSHFTQDEIHAQEDAHNGVHSGVRGEIQSFQTARYQDYRSRYIASSQFTEAESERRAHADAARDTERAYGAGRSLRPNKIAAPIKSYTRDPKTKAIKTAVDTTVSIAPGSMKASEETPFDFTDLDKTRATFPGAKLPSEADGSMKLGKPKYTPKQALGILQKSNPDLHNWLVQEASSNPGSPFYGATQNPKGKNAPSTASGARRRLETFLTAMQNGYSEKEAYSYAGNGEERRGQAPSRKAQITQRASQDMQQRILSGKSDSELGLKNKFADLAPSHEGFGMNIAVPGVDSFDTLAKKFPDWSEKDLLTYQQSQRQTAYEHTLSKNERWAHETRADRFGGGKDALNQASAEDRKNRVVVFTTNMGGPTVSIDAKGAIGQYVIMKRKKMVLDDKRAPRNQLGGSFPQAVRDQHLAEASLGGSLGAVGRLGMFQNTGVRVGNKSTKGFGKQVPAGSQVLRDSYGSAVYDKDGNLRYTEGYTRPFSASTNTVGLRIFVG